MYHEVHRDDEPRFVAAIAPFSELATRIVIGTPTPSWRQGAWPAVFYPQKRGAASARGRASSLPVECRGFQDLVTTTFRKTTTAWLAP
jgi:hypothetical protein